jgi:hypothetical protein
MASGLARQKRYGFGDVFRLAGMAEGYSLGRGFPLGVAIVGAHARGADAARGDSVGAHAKRRELEG